MDVGTNSVGVDRAMSNMKERFIHRFQRNLEAWRTGEVDYVTYNECNRETWEAIVEAGKDIEAEVVAGLRGDVLLADVGLLNDDDQPTVLRARTCRGRRFDAQRYCGDLQRNAKGPVLRVSPVRPANHPADHRLVAAVVYELAAEMERRSQQLEVHWTISPDPEASQIAVELAGDHEAELADEFIANVMSLHQLI